MVQIHKSGMKDDSRRQVGERFIVPRSQVSAFQFMEINRSWKLGAVDSFL